MSECEIRSYMSDEFRKILLEKTSSLKKKTARDYVRNAEKICSMSKKDFTDLTSEDVAAFFSSSEMRSLTKRSRVVCMRTLRSLARFTDEKLSGCRTLSAFMVSLDLPSTYIDPETLPAPEYVDRVLTLLKEENDRQGFLLIAVTLETGLSTGDLCGLKIKNFCLDQKGYPLIRIAPETEDGFFRNIPLTKKTATLITESISDPNRTGTGAEAPFFINAHGDALSERSMQMHLRDACLRAGVKPFTLTDLRNLAAAHMKTGGAPDPVLGYQLGITDTWFFRLNHAVEDLPKAASKYNHLRIEW